MSLFRSVKCSNLFVALLCSSECISKSLALFDRTQAHKILSIICFYAAKGMTIVSLEIDIYLKMELI